MPWRWNLDFPAARWSIGAKPRMDV